MDAAPLGCGEDLASCWRHRALTQCRVFKEPAHVPVGKPRLLFRNMRQAAISPFSCRGAGIGIPQGRGMRGPCGPCFEARAQARASTRGRIYRPNSAVLLTASLPALSRQSRAKHWNSAFFWPWTTGARRVVTQTRCDGATCRAFAHALRRPLGPPQHGGVLACGLSCGPRNALRDFGLG